jgi:hypothetical protein
MCHDDSSPAWCVPLVLQSLGLDRVPHAADVDVALSAAPRELIQGCALHAEEISRRGEACCAALLAAIIRIFQGSLGLDAIHKDAE